MVRCIVFAIFYSLFSLSVLGQSAADRSAEAAPIDTDQYSLHTTGSQSPGTAGGGVSINRLRVPGKAWQLYEKALEAWNKQKCADAQHEAEQALKIDPTFPDALTLYGFIQASSQHWDSAEESLQAAVRSDPNYSAAYVILAGVYNTEGRYDQAQEAIERAIAAGAHTWSVQYEIVRVLIGKGEYASALAISDQALRSKHGKLLLMARAHALLGLRRYSEAATELRAYLRDDPTGEGSQNARDLLQQLEPLVSR